jgi:hypothetical protein
MRETQGIGRVDAATPAAVPMTVRRLILRDMVLAPLYPMNAKLRLCRSKVIGCRAIRHFSQANLSA